MRAPVEFAVLRHLLQHPDDRPATLARHAHLHPRSASLALARIRDAGTWGDAAVLLRLRATAERPRWRTHHYRAPNPRQWLVAYQGPCWLSGDEAAAREGHDLVPERIIAWIPPERLQDGIRACEEILADSASRDTANLILRVADPWLAADERDPELVERGQRFWDYHEYPHIQVLRGLPV